MAWLPLSDIGALPGSGANDIWGWTDTMTGREYALVGLRTGTSFVDVSDPVNPVYLGMLPRTSGTSPTTARDVKVYRNYAYIVADGAREHGMQIFDLTLLRTVRNPPVRFTETARYDEVGSVHNLAINEETGFAYAVGSQAGVKTCDSGLHMIALADPVRPTFAGCASRQEGIVSNYMHDVQCVVYRGPDVAYQGQEICFGANETGITITDVTIKAQPLELSAARYPNVAYAHQGWLTEDHRYFFLGDEYDEAWGMVQNTRTLVWDLADLDAPLLLTEYFASTTDADHNLYIIGHYMVQANYRAGLRLIDISEVAQPIEVGFFDTVPDGSSSVGAWGVFPFFPSGTLVVSDIDHGMFILRPADIHLSAEAPGIVPGFTLSPAFPNPFGRATAVYLTLATAETVSVRLYDLLGREVALLYEGFLSAGVHRLDFKDEHIAAGTYLVRATSASGTMARSVTRTR